MKLKTLVLRDKKWLRGKKDSGLDFRGKQCCLGILGYALGAKRGCLKAYATPGDSCNYSSFKKWPSKLLCKSEDGCFYRNTELTYDIVQVNDDCGIDDEKRLVKLGKLFKKIGYKLVFKKDQ